MLQSILLAQIFTTFFMTGLIWLVQVVHYPLMADVGIDFFVDYEAKHTRSITFVVLPIMLIELGTAALLVVMPSDFSKVWLIVAFGLLLLIWASTFFLQVPLHGELSQKFDAANHQKLVSTNWIRTLLWSARSGIWLILLLPKL
ncbi:MAG: hypothetical protein AAGI23_21405 [Bacteroidota bacterium]